MNGFEQISVVVVGGVATDIFGLGFQRLAGRGELSYGGSLRIGAGGKSRNIAHMIASLLGMNRVAMIGRTSSDPFNLWRVPMDALESVGVNCQFIKVLSYEQTGKFPTVALIPVDKNGSNQIYVLPGINAEFPLELIEESLTVFKEAARNNGLLALSLELPLNAALASIKQANQCNLPVLLDPGGIDHSNDLTELLQQEIFLIKPNEHEALILTGIEIVDFASAKLAAKKLLNRKIKNVLITHGVNGAYLVNKQLAVHIKLPNYNGGQEKDETGCGDQTMAALCASLQSGNTIERAAEIAILAGTVQFYKAGIVPITQEELRKAQGQVGIVTP